MRCFLYVLIANPYYYSLRNRNANNHYMLKIDKEKSLFSLSIGRVLLLHVELYFSDMGHSLSLTDQLRLRAARATNPFTIICQYRYTNFKE